MTGKAIELFLVNGSADSLTTAELSNWNGKAIKIPRTEITECDRDDIKGVGVYFLICQEDDGTDSVYIGEAENVLDRLTQHLRDYQSGKEKYYWNTVLKEAQIASMEEFIDNVKILINTLGYKVLVLVPKATDDTVYLYCKGSGASAKGFVSTGGFQRDYEFNAPSAASAVVLGHTSNGKVDWKTEDGVKLKDLNIYEIGDE